MRVYAAACWIAAGRASRALVLASEVENNARFGPNALIGLEETGSALLLEQSTSGEGFGRFVFRAFPERVGDIRAFTAWENGAVMLHHERIPEWERHAASGLKLAIGELLELEGLRPDDIKVFLPTFGSDGFVALLSEVLELPQARFLDLSGAHRDYFTSSLGYGFQAARRSGRVASGDVGVILAAGSGGQVGCCVYYF